MSYLTMRFGHLVENVRQGLFLLPLFTDPNEANDHLIGDCFIIRIDGQMASKFSFAS